MENRNDTILTVEQAKEMTAQRIEEFRKKKLVEIAEGESQMRKKLPELAQTMYQKKLSKVKKSADTQTPSETSTSKSTHAVGEVVVDEIGEIEKSLTKDLKDFHDKERKRLFEAIEQEEKRMEVIIQALADAKLLTAERLDLILQQKYEGVRYNIVLLNEGRTRTLAQNQLLTKEVVDGMLAAPKWATNVGAGIMDLINATRKELETLRGKKIAETETLNPTPEERTKIIDNEDNILNAENIKVLIDNGEYAFFFGSLIGRMNEFLSFNTLRTEYPEQLSHFAKNEEEIRDEINEIENSYMGLIRSTRDKNEILNLVDDMLNSIEYLVNTKIGDILAVENWIQMTGTFEKTKFGGEKPKSGRSMSTPPSPGLFKDPKTATQESQVGSKSDVTIKKEGGKF